MTRFLLIISLNVIFIYFEHFPMIVQLHMYTDQGNQKQALVPKQLMHKYEQIFKEQDLYEIETFDVIKTDDNSRVVDEELTVFICVDIIVKKTERTNAENSTL